MTKLIYSFLLISAIYINSTVVFAKTTTERVGDYTATLLPVSAAAISLIRGDTEGLWLLTKSVALSSGLVGGLKIATKKKRPNYDNTEMSNQARNSFPSGHTQSAFSGAAYLQTRYGLSYGIPAYILAIYTGYSRVHAQKHFIDDVMAGASIATLSNLVFLRSEDGTYLRPVLSKDKVGFSLTTSLGSQKSQKGLKQNFKYEFFPSITEIKSDDLKTNNPLLEITNEEDEIATGVFKWSYIGNEKNEYFMTVRPYEIRSTGFYNGSNLNQVRFQTIDLKIGWLKDIFTSKIYKLKIGAGLLFKHSEIEVYDGSPIGGSLFQEKEIKYYPELIVSNTFSFSDKLSLELEFEYGYKGEGTLYEGLAFLNYEITSIWDIAAGFSTYERKLSDTTTLKHLKLDSTFLKVGYKFNI